MGRYELSRVSHLTRRAISDGFSSGRGIYFSGLMEVELRQSQRRYIQSLQMRGAPKLQRREERPTVSTFNLRTKWYHTLKSVSWPFSSYTRRTLKSLETDDEFIIFGTGNTMATKPSGYTLTYIFSLGASSCDDWVMPSPLRTGR